MTVECPYLGTGKSQWIVKLAKEGWFTLSPDGGWCDQREPLLLPDNKPEEPIDISCVGPDSPECPMPQSAKIK